MGNNLKYARELMIEPTTEQDTADAQAFALIAIAEQLERIANPTPYQPQPLQVMSDEERKALEDK